MTGHMARPLSGLRGVLITSTTLLCGLTVACSGGESPAADAGGGGGGTDGGNEGSSLLVSTTNADGSVRSDIDASDGETWLYISLSFENGRVQDVTDAENSSAWDIAIKRTSFQTNSGTSGPGEGGAMFLAEEPFEDVKSVPTEDGCYLILSGHVCDCETLATQTDCEENDGIWTPDCYCPPALAVDEMGTFNSPPGTPEFSGNPALNDWFNYDQATHSVSAKGGTFILSTASGAFVKMRIKSYVEGIYEVDWQHAEGDTTF